MQNRYKEIKSVNQKGALLTIDDASPPTEAAGQGLGGICLGVTWGLREKPNS